MVSVARAWPGSTIVCVATGPSLTREDVDMARRIGRVIAVNDAYRYAPWADVLYAADAAWWRHHLARLKDFRGLRFSVEIGARGCGASVLLNTGMYGLESRPTGLRSGRNSGYQAINLAVHLGAARIVLLGYDCELTNGQAHFFGAHPKALRTTTLHRFREWRDEMFPTLVSPLAALGIEIINASARTALTCFARQPIRELMPVLESAS